MKSMDHPDYEYQPWSDERRQRASERARGLDWKIGDAVRVSGVAGSEWRKPEAFPWSGTGTIDMIQHGGNYIRVVSEQYYAWVNSDDFGKVSKIEFHPEIDSGPAIGMEFPNARPDPTEDQLAYVREVAEQTRQRWQDREPNEATANALQEASDRHGENTAHPDAPVLE